MRRFVGISVIAFALAAINASAIAAGGDYQGTGKSDTWVNISFDVAKHNGKQKVKKFIASTVGYSCDGGNSGVTSGVELQEAFPVDSNGRFGGKSAADILGFDPKAELHGKLKDGGKASGTIRVHGELDPENQPGVKCDTGEVEWVAEKVAHP